MKRSVILSVLAAVAIFAVCANAEAGMFGRLHILKGGCNPCEPCQPCEPCKPACEPCTPPACEPCQPACCEPCCDAPCAKGPFRPFGGFLLGLRSKLAVKHCSPCEPCNPCEPTCCEPCNPCEPTCCDPCGGAPLRPFKGFFTNAWARLKAKSCNPCNPCEPVCEPCNPCN